MGSSVSLPRYHIGQLLYSDPSTCGYPAIPTGVVQVKSFDKTSVMAVLLPIHAASRYEVFPFELAEVALQPLSRRITSPMLTALKVSRIPGTICEALWGVKWRVSRITHVGQFIELQCAEEDHELPLLHNTQGLAPVGTHCLGETTLPPVRPTHRERIVATIYEAKTLLLRAELKSQETAAMAIVQSLRALLASVESSTPLYTHDKLIRRAIEQVQNITMASVIPVPLPA